MISFDPDVVHFESADFGHIWSGDAVPSDLAHPAPDTFSSMVLRPCRLADKKGDLAALLVEIRTLIVLVMLLLLPMHLWTMVDDESCDDAV